MEFAMYFLMGVVAPSFLNLIHLVLNIYIVVARGNILSLGFSGISFLTKSMGMIFFTWLFSHIAEAFVIQHYMEENVPKWFKELQIK